MTTSTSVTHKVKRKAKWLAKYCLGQIKKPFTSRTLKEIDKDLDLRQHGIYETVCQIRMNYTGKPADFVLREIASFILNVGHPHLAKKYYRLSLELNPNPDTHSLYLQCLLLDPSVTEAELYHVAVQYEKFFPNIQPQTVHTNTLEPDRKLNIGYLCHFFYNSVSKSLLLPAIRAHHASRVNIFCYSDAPPEMIDDETRSITQNWRNTLHMSNDELTKLIQEDKIDILLELNGHCFLNRYNVIARKAAPIQINYYNQSATTGLKSIDYVLIGEGVKINQSYYTEQVHQMKGVQGVAIFPESFPKVSPLPSLSKGYIVFGSFGNAHKVNTEVVELWCKLLHKLPTAKLFMKASVLTHSAYKNVYISLFNSHGIGEDRLIIEGHSEHLDMLERYKEVDIALDTFPHAAGTTTMEALWQGIPVVTLCGERYCSQNGRIILTAVGHTELLTYSEDEYINLAISLANDQTRLKKYRNELREDFKKSLLCNPESFATRLEDAFEKMWHRYIANNTVSQ